MNHLNKIMTILDDDKLFPTRTEWAYVEICNELKMIHLKLKELQGKVVSTATLDPSAPPRHNI
jgi:hypothetical protein